MGGNRIWETAEKTWIYIFLFVCCYFAWRCFGRWIELYWKGTESCKWTEEVCVGKVLTSASGSKTKSTICYWGVNNQGLFFLSLMTLPFQGHIWLDLVRQYLSSKEETDLHNYHMFWQPSLLLQLSAKLTPASSITSMWTCKAPVHNAWLIVQQHFRGTLSEASGSP